MLGELAAREESTLSTAFWSCSGGQVVSDLPMLVKVGEAKFLAMGQTKMFFGNRFETEKKLLVAQPIK
ncbi:MAG TPA: hypothetical protein VNE86_06030 [Nitrososphaerales archaeon]|nr:hypothetical protein [Nitrososphaerales archaeon]